MHQVDFSFFTQLYFSLCHRTNCEKSRNIKYGPGWTAFIYNKGNPYPLITLIINVCEFEEKESFLDFSCGKLLSSPRDTTLLRKDYFGTTKWARSLSFYMLHSVPCTFYSRPLYRKLKIFLS